MNAIRMLLRAGVKTNIHYVLGNNTIDEAIEKRFSGEYVVPADPDSADAE